MVAQYARKFILVFLSLTIALVAFPWTAQAITGDDVASAAESQIGNGYLTYTRDYMGSSGGTYVYHWCAAFTSWCGDKAGAYSQGYTPKNLNCNEQMKWFKAAPANKANWYEGYSDYIPQRGDFIFFTGKYEPGVPHHVGIVVGVSGSKVTVVEGNAGGTGSDSAWIKSSSVKRNSYSYTNDPGVENKLHIVGYGHPMYDSNHLPEGSVDAIRAAAGKVYVGGWAKDPDEPSAKIAVHVYIGDEGHAISADQKRDDVGSHAFDSWIETSKTGKQTVRVYAIDSQGGENALIGEGEVNIPANKGDGKTPVTSDVKVTNIDQTGYTVSCVVSDADGIEKVQFPSWSENDGNKDGNSQDDIVWYDGKLENGRWSVRVNVANHNNGDLGFYTTHIYAYDKTGDVGKATLDSVLVPKAVATYNGRTYYLADMDCLPCTWEQAEAYCASSWQKGHLATITSAGENAAVAGLAAKSNKSYLWLGATDAASEGTWAWANGTGWGYANWGPSDPNGGTSENYLCMYKDGTWQDLPLKGSGSIPSRMGFVMEVGTDAKPSIADAAVKLAKASYSYTGSAIKPAVTITAGGQKLALGTDYTMSYSSNTAVGTATVTVTGKGGFTGSKSVTFKIEAASLSGAEVTLSSDLFTYTGSAIKPVATVSLGGKTLAVGTDYAVSYSNNVVAGIATVTVAGKGNYTGSKTATFRITPASIAGAEVTFPSDPLVYTGSAIEPTPAVKLGGKTLVAGTDYAVYFENNVNAGAATASIVGLGNYAGGRPAEFEIAPAPISGASVTLEKDSYEWNGTAPEPAVSVEVADVVLTRDTDYDVSYEGNDGPGTATVTVTGRGNYTGSRSATFEIAAPESSEKEYAKTPRGYAEMLYNRLVGLESPTEFQLTWWAGKLSEDAASAVASFASSNAFGDMGYTPYQAAQVLYHAILNNASPTEFQLTWWEGRAKAVGAVAAAKEMTDSDSFRAACSEYGLGTGAVPDPDPEPSEKEYAKTPRGYAEMLYGELLGNASPTEAQLDWWEPRLSADPASAVAGFASSPAFAGKGYAPEEAARLLYAAVLGNASPTDFQVSWWAGRVSELGPEGAASEMTGSGAFLSVCAEYGLGAAPDPVDPDSEPSEKEYDKTPRGYAEMLYNLLVGNASPTDFQLSWWEGELLKDAAAAVSSFASSNAFGSMGYTSEQAARVLYAAILGNSSPSDFQVSWWAGRVSELGLEAAAAEMTDSDAFRSICSEYGLAIVSADAQDDSDEPADAAAVEEGQGSEAEGQAGPDAPEDGLADAAATDLEQVADELATGDEGLPDAAAGEDPQVDSDAAEPDAEDTDASSGPDASGPAEKAFEPTPRGYAELLYARLLGIDDPSDGGLSALADALSGDAASAVLDFVSDDAFCNAGYTDAEAARALCSALLDLPDPSEQLVSQWAARVIEVGVDAATKEMAASEEFRAVCERYGLALIQSESSEVPVPDAPADAASDQGAAAEPDAPADGVSGAPDSAQAADEPEPAGEGDAPEAADGGQPLEEPAEIGSDPSTIDPDDESEPDGEGSESVEALE